MLDLMRAKMAGTLVIPEGESILIPSGEGNILGSKTYDFSIINAPISLASKKRHSDKIQIRFRVDAVKKIDLDNYLPQFVYFETITIHLLSLINASSLDEYYKKQKEYRDIDLMARTQSLRENAKLKKISNVGKLASLLEVRNEIAHNLYPIAITYNNNIYPYDDISLIDLVKNDSDKVMEALVKLYGHYIGKLEKWLQPILEKTPAQVILMADGSIKTHEKQY